MIRASAPDGDVRSDADAADSTPRSLRRRRAAEEAAAAKEKSSTSPKKLNFSAPTTLELKPPPPAHKDKTQAVAKADLAAQPALVADFTPPQGSFAQRLKRVNAIGRPQNQLELAELIAALGDEHGQIRYLAGALLGRLGSMIVVNLLGSYLQTNPGDVAQREAATALRQIAGSAKNNAVQSAARKLIE